MAQRYRDYLDAVTASDPAVVEAFVKKYDVAYLVVDVGFSERGEQMWNFKPFDEYLAERLAANPDRNFAVNQLPAELYVKVENNYRILDCRRWLGK